MKSWIERASSWNVVEVVRPQPGQAATSGTKVRKPMVCSSSCATWTSSVRSPPGSGVSEMRMVSPMPCCSRMPSAARRGDDALRAHAGLGEAEMDGVVRARGQVLVDRDQVLHRGDLGRQDHLVLRQADLLGARRRQQRRLHHRLARHRADIARVRPSGVLVHQLGEQFLVERTPIGADPHRLVVLDARSRRCRRIACRACS